MVAAKAPVGRTEDGTQFAVPESHDLVHNLSGLKFNLFEIIALVLCWSQLGLLLLGVPRWVLVLQFVFWRLAYNAGLGWLLHHQSNDRFVSRWVSPYLAPGTKSREFLKKQLTSKMGKDYDFEKVPLEYNIWLCFRHFVDFVLWNDFTAYFVVTFAFWEHPSPFTLVDGLFHLLGFGMCVLCYFIKMDAIRVVGDFAWYWGDFFFLIDAQLTFDGVFQMAPHPMYSIGYLGYYGLCILSRSYAVLYISLAAHTCQFLFLTFVENPHIERTYNSVVDESEKLHHRRHHVGLHAMFHRDTIVLYNLDLLRSFDFATAVILVLSIFLFFSGLPVWVFLVMAVFWRVFHSGVLGWVLHKQSKERWVTRHFVKLGGTRQEAFQSWKQIYNLSLMMTHTSFISAAAKVASVPDSLLGGYTLLKITVGFLLIALHAWSSREMFEVIREFGWFYGDFFLDPVSKSPEYTGIYRFVNNPEKVLGQASFYGIALIADSWIVFGLALFSHCAMAMFLHFVESPHMRSLYGDDVRSESGFKQAMKTKLLPYQKKFKPFKLLAELDQMVDRGANKLRLAAASSSSDIRVKDEVKMKIEDMRVAVRKADLIFRGTRPSHSVCEKYKISVEGGDSFEIGKAIVVKWSAPAQHTGKEWIGIYPVGENKSVEVTTKTSRGRWVWMCADPSRTSGIATFTAASLPWAAGTYEARLHYDGHYGVLAVSEPFEIDHGESFPQQEGKTDVSELAEIFTRLFRELLEKPDIEPTTEFMVDSWSVGVKRAVTEYLESAFSVSISQEVLARFNSPTLIALWVEGASDALGTFGNGGEPLLSPNKRKEE